MTTANCLPPELRASVFGGARDISVGASESTCNVPVLPVIGARLEMFNFAESADYWLQVAARKGHLRTAYHAIISYYESAALEQS